MKKYGLRSAGLAALFLILATADLAAQEGNSTTHNGHTYTIFEDECSWEEAKNACENRGGHLVTITSRAEQKAITTLIKSGNKKFYWIGGMRKKSSNFIWVTGEKFSYLNWSSDAPTENGLGNKNAIMLYKSNGLWKDENGDKPSGKASALKNYGYICEWDDSDDAISFADDSAYEDYDEDEDVANITIAPEAIGISIPAGKKVRLFGPSGAKWHSSNPKVAKVTKDGVVMAVAKGTAVISVERAGAVTVRVED